MISFFKLLAYILSGRIFDIKKEQFSKTQITTPAEFAKPPIFPWFLPGLEREVQNRLKRLSSLCKNQPKEDPSILHISNQKRIENAVVILSEAVQSIRQNIYAQPESVGSIPIKDLIELIFEVFSERAQINQTEFKLDFSPEFPNSVAGDQRRIVQVVTLVIGHAIRFTQAGTIVLTCLFQDQSLIFSIADSGEDSLNLNESIDDHGIDKIEEGAQENQRIVLQLASQIADGMAGSLLLKSEKRLGNIVTIRLPVKIGAEKTKDQQSLNALFYNSSEAKTHIQSMDSVRQKGLDYMRQELTALRSAIRDNRMDEIRKILHDMKGVPAGLGFKSIFSKVKEIEKIINENGNIDPKLQVCLEELTKGIEDYEFRFDKYGEHGHISPGNRFQQEPLFRKNKAKILIADDNRMNQEFIVYLMESLDFDYEIASHGGEVLSALAKEKYDLLLLDMKMPEMDGWETMAHLRSVDEWKHLPVIAVTGQETQGDEEQYRKVGCNDYVSKPIDINELNRKIKQLLDVHDKGQRS